ncbi:hypothetical protein O206_21400 [Ochrobactrum sp. EGD-AQ16]|nr:hypothetical protein O206_21400 [Ochrobactrum sp. EGD-AQ16]
MTRNCAGTMSSRSSVFTDVMHDTTAARANQAVRFDDLFNTWQWKRFAFSAA